MTHAATKLVTPLTFSALSGRAVATDWTRDEGEFRIEHIDLADRTEALVVAPATANFLAKAAYGLADDMLSSTLLALHCPVVVAPAMNVNMWENPQVKRNLAAVRELGYDIVEPDEGYLACGWTGRGRLADTALIAARVEEALLRPLT